MIYLKQFELPSKEAEENALTTIFAGLQKGRYGEQFFENCYPFGIFPEIDFRVIDFDDITILHGNNGSGKSTILNVIAAKLHATRNSVYNTGRYTNLYLQLCHFQTDMRWTGEEFDYSGKRSGRYDIAEITRVITSDDIFKAMLHGRVQNDQIRFKAEMLGNKVYAVKHGGPEFRPKHINLETGENLSRFKDAVEINRLSGTKYIREKLGKEERGFSNGETGFMYISEMFSEEGLYILDEPENSLSADLQMKLAELIQYMVRYNNCQVIISTHSPFLLSMEDAKIYDLDTAPVNVCKFNELDSMKKYVDLFQKHFS
ncbi:MAG: AAA family ATPase [Muribaculaceae bacterium]|nr:AAA family ATPase [Muribaculaceae bacterium]